MLIGAYLKQQTSFGGVESSGIEVLVLSKIFDVEHKYSLLWKDFIQIINRMVGTVNIMKIRFLEIAF